MYKVYVGGAAAVSLSAQLLNTNTTSFTTNVATGFPTSGPFVIAVTGTGTYEKILISSRSGTTFNIQTRGYDDTAAITHNTPATVTHVLDAAAIQEANGILNGSVTWPGISKFADGTVAAPSITFGSNTGHGFYYSAGYLNLSLGGTQRWRMGGNQAELNDGTAANPSYSFIADNDTGMFRSANNAVSLVANGVTLLTAGDGANRVLFHGGAASAPGLAFIADGDTGMFKGVSDNSLGFATNGVSRMSLDTANLAISLHVLPVPDNTYQMGSASNRWTVVYATTGTINTSDMELKQSVKPALGLDFINALNPIEYKFKDGKRPHQGFAAQQVKQAMDNLAIKDFAGYIDPNVSGDEGSLGLRYSEFIAPLVRAVQELSEKIDALEAKNA